jgi:hypothetical protein
MGASAEKDEQNAPDDASLSLARQPPGGFALPSDKTIHAIGLLLVTLVVTSAAAARASCICRCVDGEMQPFCSTAIDLPPIYPLTICGVVPPSIAPITPLAVPPIGTTSCQMRQVQNPMTRTYEWRRICE